MKLDKAEKRDKARHKKKNGMRRDGDSVKTIRQIQVNKAKKIKERKK